jgi:hypothetical protein
MSGYTERMGEFLDGLHAVNTHCHHLPTEEHVGMDLNALLERTYVSWCNEPIGTTAEQRADFLSKVRSRSYFVWLERALQTLYGLAGPLASDNWDDLSARIGEAHRSDSHHIELLTDVCGYDRIVLDAYWNPGSDNGLPGLFAPTFRINMFLYGYDRDAEDHNGNNPQRIYDRDIGDLDGYVRFMREVVEEKKRAGCVAIKSALAYDRSILYGETDRSRAGRVFGAGGEPSPQDVLAFQDYIFHEVCRTAGEIGLPLQCHTGLGELDRTNAMQMRDLIVKYPDTTFVLFHGGYPWTDDVCGLVHRYPNVYVDLCWLPIISPSAAHRFIHEVLEVANADRITWGCDTWRSEESLGALMAFRTVLARVLAEKIESGYLTEGRAREIAENIFHRNARSLYGLKD